MINIFYYGKKIGLVASGAFSPILEKGILTKEPLKLEDEVAVRIRNKQGSSAVCLKNHCELHTERKGVFDKSISFRIDDILNIRGNGHPFFLAKRGFRNIHGTRESY